MYLVFSFLQLGVVVDIKYRNNWAQKDLRLVSSCAQTNLQALQSCDNVTHDKIKMREIILFEIKK